MQSSKNAEHRIDVPPLPVGKSKANMMAISSPVVQILKASLEGRVYFSDSWLADLLTFARNQHVLLSGFTCLPNHPYGRSERHVVFFCTFMLSLFFSTTSNSWPSTAIQKDSSNGLIQALLFIIGLRVVLTCMTEWTCPNPFAAAVSGPLQHTSTRRLIAVNPVALNKKQEALLFTSRCILCVIAAFSVFLGFMMISLQDASSASANTYFTALLYQLLLIEPLSICAYFSAKRQYEIYTDYEPVLGHFPKFHVDGDDAKGETNVIKKAFRLHKKYIELHSGGVSRSNQDTPRREAKETQVERAHQSKSKSKSKSMQNGKNEGEKASAAGADETSALVPISARSQAASSPDGVISGASGHAFVISTPDMLAAARRLEDDKAGKKPSLDLTNNNHKDSLEEPEDFTGLPSRKPSILDQSMVDQRLQMLTDFARNENASLHDLQEEEALGDKIYILPSPVKIIDPQVLEQWDFNVFDYDKPTLLWCVREMLWKDGAIAKYNIPEGELAAFIRLLPLYYFSNPYHNFYHGVFVMQCVYVMLRQMRSGEGEFSDHDRFSILVAAVCHDIAHPGLNNAHLVNTKNELAIHFKNVSVLENLHFLTAWRLLCRPKYNFLKNMESSELMEFKDKMEMWILATDMAQHFDILKEFNASLKEGTLTKEMKMKMVLKCADLSNAAKPWKESAEWNSRIAEEFYQQGDREKMLGVTPAPNLDREKSEPTQNSINFIDFIAKPLFESFVDWNPNAKDTSELVAMNKAVLYSKTCTRAIFSPCLVFKTARKVLSIRNLHAWGSRKTFVVFRNSPRSFKERKQNKLQLVPRRAQKIERGLRA